MSDKPGYTFVVQESPLSVAIPPLVDADPGFALIGVDVKLSHLSRESCTCDGCCTV